MKLTKKELLERFAQSDAVMDEVYQWTGKVQHFTEDGPHGDFVSFLGGIEEALLDDEYEYECDFYTMNEAEYNGSIMASFSPQSDFEEEYGDKNATVFVVVVDYLEDHLLNRR